MASHAPITVKSLCSMTFGRHNNQTKNLNVGPRFFSVKDSPDVSGIICQALCEGPGP
jgi:hypothetical protein